MIVILSLWIRSQRRIPAIRASRVFLRNSRCNYVKGERQMIIHVSQVKVAGAHSLDLTFDNGVRKRVNLRKELYGPIFEPLREPSYFAKAFVDSDSRTVSWPNGA